jgi:hypothetical protein
MPSSRRQIWATADALRSVKTKRGCTARSALNNQLHREIGAERGQHVLLVGCRN